MTTRPIAPLDLPIPGFLREVFDSRTSRESRVLEPGFGADSLAVTWWQDEIAKEPQPGGSVSLDPLGEGATAISRATLFKLGEVSLSRSHDDDLLTFLWHVLMWGSGTTARNNVRRIDAFRDAELRRQRIDSLRTAANYARAGDRRAAYSSLIRKGGGVIPGLGPAFFTKFLYFASGDRNPAGCLILDARVARSLFEAGCSLRPLTTGTKKGSITHSYNWYTDTYVSYCELLDHWARTLSESQATPVWADEVELALFSQEWK